MRHLSSILARLYPRSWRARYGEEFDALIEEADAGPATAWNVLTGAIAMQIKTWSLSWIFAGAGVFTCAVFLAAGTLIPKAYVSQGILRVDSTEARDAMADFLHDAVDGVESRGALAGMITAEDLYPRERSQRPLESVVETMRRDITVEPLAGADGPLTAIRVEFAYPDPRTAQRVTDKLLALLVSQSADSPTALRVLDRASSPVKTQLNVPLAAATAAALAGLLSLGLIFLLRGFVRRKA